MTAGPVRRVLVTPRSLTQAGLGTVEALDPLRAAGLHLVSGPPGRLPTEAEQLYLVPGCVGWLAGVERIGATALDAATDLQVISRNGTGTDGIDLVAAEQRGVRVVRAAGANAQSVAELALTVALSGLRHVPWTAASVAAGAWTRAEGRELEDCTVGVVGMGAIGRRVAHLFTAVGARVVAHDPFADLTGSSVAALDLDELLALADVVTLHLPAPPEGGALLDARRLALLPSGAVLVNTARAALVDDDAVLAALASGRLSAYAVDAYDEEPPPPSALLSHPRVIATPHLGGYTAASVRRATEQAVTGLIEALDQGR